MATLGLIFPGSHCKEDLTLTKHRVVASVPVGGRYRLIDFTLSNMINNGISHVGIVAINNYQSLIDHVGSGKEWDLARNNSGLVFLPPYMNKVTTYGTRLESIKNLVEFIRRCPEEYVVMTDSYFLCNMDLTPAFQLMFEKEADIVCIYHKHTPTENDYHPYKTLGINKDGRITSLTFLPDTKEEVNLSLDIWIMRKDLLVDMIDDAIVRNLHSFNLDILSNSCDKYNVYGYNFEGYYGEVTSLKSYFNLNMDFLKDDVRKELFYNPHRQIYTKVRGSVPTKYLPGSKVKNCTIGDGCVIEGYVENCVLFRGVHVGKDSVVKNSVIMQDTVIGKNCNLDYVITDKDVVISDNNIIKASYEDLKFIKKGEHI